MNKCANPLCNREAATWLNYCCNPCAMAHKQKYEIHEDGILGHSCTEEPDNEKQVEEPDDE